MRNGGEPDVPVHAPAAPGAIHAPRDAAARPGRLFRKYLLLILTLVTGALLASGGITVYFSIQEHKSALGDLQHEKAVAAASRIEQYLTSIIAQLVYAALPQLGDGDVDMRKLEFNKLLRQVPEVTDICQLNPQGLETLCVSRLGMDSVGSMKDRSDEPAFKEAKPGRPYIGPVYFRKETEPYMTIGVRAGGERGPVNIADINLKFIWDVVSRIQIGDKGKAYAVDGRGYLVADPDIGLVLRKTNLAHLPHVKAALESQPRDSLSMLSEDLAGTSVLASFAPIESLKWFVFAEQPAVEVYSKLNASILRTGLLLLAGLVISALAALALARGMVRPIRTLSDGARRIGEGDLDQRIEVKTGDELEALANRFNRMSSQLKESYAGLERKVDERTHELQNSLEQQTAISDILRVISSSPTDVQPVLDAVAERAAYLCNAPYARVLIVRDQELVPAAEYAVGGETRVQAIAVPLQRTSITGRAALERRTIHHADVVPLLDSEFPHARQNAETAGIRAILAVPLIREGGAYGAIFTYRREPGLFAPDQVALLETFARQAAIAIDNVRLFNETKEALDQQTAISEILRVISGSPTDVQPVLDAVAERALKLCDAAQAVVILREGADMRFAAGYGGLPSAVGTTQPLNRGLVAGRAILDATTIHVEDLAQLSEAEYPVSREMQRLRGHHTLLAVPLMREDLAIGSIALWRMETRKFSDKQVALVQTFADQAAIAIDNVRLFNETREALDQQTAISEILRAISGSPTDVMPVLDAIAERAARLCEAAAASIYLIEGGQLRHLASQGTIPDATPTIEVLPIDRQSMSGRAVLEGHAIHVHDMLAEVADYPLSAELAHRFGHRTVLVVPLFREGQPFGTILLRRLEMRPFTEREIALLKTFGDQAAIAIENVRLFNETKEALEQQTATADVLKTISRTTFELDPVLETLIESATRLCKANKGAIYLRRGATYEYVAGHGATPDQIAFMHQHAIVPGPGSVVGVVAQTGQLVHLDDAKQDASYTWQAAQEIFGFRSIFGVPMLREGEPIGVVVMWRKEVRPFSQRERQLVATFADQAVIAIQNVRLLSETKEALDQQRASGEVLTTISSSIADTKPVFDKILESCERLFAGKLIGVNLVGEDGLLRIGAYHGPGREEFEKIFPAPVDEGTGTGRAILRREVLHFPDIEHDDQVPAKMRHACNAIKIKAVIFAPMLWEGRGIGAVFVGRDTAGPFSEKDISLLRTFADQAVIAIQNARLFNETQEALDQQRASGEVLSAISSSIADTSPVFEAILDSCERLFAGKNVGINVLAPDGTLRLGAYHGPRREEFERLMGSMQADDSTGTGLAIRTRTVQHYPDMDAPDVPEKARMSSKVLGSKAVIFAPMLWEGQGLGVIWVARDFAGPFSEKDIALLKTFAEQAVIAIQNARLFNETQEALDQQRASGEVLSAISSSIADTSPVFETILASCERLFEGKIGVIDLVGEDGLVHLGAYHGPRVESMREVYPHPADDTSGTGTAITTRNVVHYSGTNRDAMPAPALAAFHAMGIKSCIGAPMLWEGKGIGAVWVGRDFAGPFSDKDIGLLKTFSEQAVIAIQNARLFREIQDKSRLLEIANQHKSDFLANMSHELRTPLNAIIGFSEVLLEHLFGELNEKQDDYLKDIHSSGRHLLALINDILDLSKIEAGRMELESSSFHLPTTLSDAMTFVRERALKHQIGLGLDVDPAVDDVVADERKVKQILVNLLTNAVKFTPDGGRVNLSVRREPGQVVIAVRDTGIGIAAKDHETVFEEFRQVGGPNINKPEGTGLGLPLARKFVELHGGRIWLDSAPGEGSTFTFTLPDPP